MTQLNSPDPNFQMLPDVIETKLHIFRVSLRTEFKGETLVKHFDEFKEEYEKAIFGVTPEHRCHYAFSAHKDKLPSSPGVYTVLLSTDALFDNQWNTAPVGHDIEGLNNARIFDWYESAEDGYRPSDEEEYRTPPNIPIWRRRFISGHWLEITDEMRLVRSQVTKCGYCGKMYREGNTGFCDSCIGSRYLTADCLHQLRLRPVGTRFSAHRANLTSEEMDILYPEYVKAQKETWSKITESRRARDIKKANRQLAEAHKRYDIGLWLVEHMLGSYSELMYINDEGVVTFFNVDKPGYLREALETNDFSEVYGGYKVKGRE